MTLHFRARHFSAGHFGAGHVSAARENKQCCWSCRRALYIFNDNFVYFERALLNFCFNKQLFSKLQHKSKTKKSRTFRKIWVLNKKLRIFFCKVCNYFQNSYFPKVFRIFCFQPIDRKETQLKDLNPSEIANVHGVRRTAWMGARAKLQECIKIFQSMEFFDFLAEYLQYRLNSIWQHQTRKKHQPAPEFRSDFSKLQTRKVSHSQYKFT